MYRTWKWCILLFHIPVYTDNYINGSFWCGFHCWSTDEYRCIGELNSCFCLHLHASMHVNCTFMYIANYMCNCMRTYIAEHYKALLYVFRKKLFWAENNHYLSVITFVTVVCICVKVYMGMHICDWVWKSTTKIT